MPEPPPRRYKVGVSDARRELLDAELEWAIPNGLASEFVAAVREIDFRLTVEPRDWGESREWLPIMRVQMRCGTSRMITVVYGVAEDEDEVFVREFRINRAYKPPKS